jgi:hypothetical protein
MCTYNVCHDVSFCQCEAHTTWLDNNLLCLWLWWVLDMLGERLGSHAQVNYDKKKEAANWRDHKLSDPMYPTRRDIVPNMWWLKTWQMALWRPSMDIYLSIAIAILSSQLNKILAVCHIFVFRMSANGWFTWIIWKKIMKMDIPWIF